MWANNSYLLSATLPEKAFPGPRLSNQSYHGNGTTRILGQGRPGQLNPRLTLMD